MTNLEWIKTLSSKDLALIMNHEIHNITKSYTSSLGAIELWLDSERVDCTVENCVFKNEPIMCRVCWSRAKRVEEEPQEREGE